MLLLTEVTFHSLHLSVHCTSSTYIHSFIDFILPLTRNTTTVYRNTLKITYNILTKLLTKSNVVKEGKPI